MPCTRRPRWDGRLDCLYDLNGDAHGWSAATTDGDTGVRAASGVYFVKLRDERGAASEAKLVLLRR